MSDPLVVIRMSKPRESTLRILGSAAHSAQGGKSSALIFFSALDIRGSALISKSSALILTSALEI
ncbi:hypothetical protein Scep_012088 [Stephania cephalantha]|uniref:Uncharacterized protein n=1 Tax=Stephania cephalantha TaxID=152367 RepID=A0AAP0JFD6_9MAGN